MHFCGNLSLYGSLVLWLNGGERSLPSNKWQQAWTPGELRRRGGLEPGSRPVSGQWEGHSWRRRERQQQEWVVTWQTIGKLTGWPHGRSGEEWGPCPKKWTGVGKNQQRPIAATRLRIQILAKASHCTQEKSEILTYQGLQRPAKSGSHIPL